MTTIPESMDSSLALVPSVQLRECLIAAEAEIWRAYSRMLAVVGEMENRQFAQEHGFRSGPTFLSRLLRISATEAKERVAHATMLTPGRAPGGASLPVTLPRAAAALAGGDLGVGQVRVIIDTLGALSPKIDDAQRELIESDLVARARDFEPRRLAILARRIRDHVDPDGPEPPEPPPPAASVGELRWRERRDGGLNLEGWLDAEAGTRFRALIEPLATPRPVEDGIPDRRSTAQRQADALAEICGIAASAEEAPSSGGERPHLAITMSLEALRSGLGAAMLDYGHRLSPAEVRHLACDAAVIPAVLGGPSEVLDVGRIKRSVSSGLRRAVVFRDRGCSFPGCDRPARRCDVHHAKHWAEGGESSLGNCCLLCPRHHREVHRTGWEVVIRTDRVEFIPPAVLDPLRKPLINSYWR